MQRLKGTGRRVEGAGLELLLGRDPAGKQVQSSSDKFKIIQTLYEVHGMGSLHLI